MARSPKTRDEVIQQLAEVFREHGFEGTTLAVITKVTGLGKGSLYHFFPGGKERMAEAVLGHINDWFQSQVFDPLANSECPLDGLNDMLSNVEDYFRSGQRLCIIGVFAVGESRDHFSSQIRVFFDRWNDALNETLRKAGLSVTESEALSLELLVAVQGGLVVARAIEDNTAFTKTIEKLRQSLEVALDGTA